MPTTVTLTNLCQQGASALSLFFFAVQANVFTVSTNIPTDLSPCQEAIYQITLTNSSAQAQAAGSLQYCLPDGLVYTGVDGLAPANVSDPRCPVFNLPAVAGNGSVSFQVHVRVGCSAQDKGGVRDTLRITTGGVPQDPLLGSEYNIRIPVITLTTGQNWNYTGGMGDTYTRTFVLKNEGFGAAYQLFVIDTFSKAGLQLQNTTGAVHGDTLILTGLDLGPNGFLGHSDSVLVTQQLTMTGCPEQALFVVYGWTCPDGQTCTVNKFDQYNLSSVNTPAPVLVLSPVGTLTTPKPCEPSPLQFKLENTGAAPALNIDWTAGLARTPIDPAATWSKFDCFPLESFRAGSAALSDASPADPLVPHHLVFSGLLTDPDGPGGLSDEDGDGQFDDLAPGNSALLTMTVAFDPLCKPCNALLDPWYVTAQVGYGSTCAKAVSAGLNGVLNTNIAFSGSKFNDLNDFLYEAGKVYDFDYEIDGTFTGLQNVCPNDSLILRIDLPLALQAPPGFQPLLDGTVVPYWTEGDSVLFLLLPDPTGDLTLPLLTVCPPDIDDSSPCSKPYAPRTYRVQADLSWTCGNGCGQRVELLCLNGNPFTLDCPRPVDTTQMHGVMADSFSVRRISLGFTDNSLSTRVDPSTPGLLLDRGIPYDTVLLQAFATFEGTAGDNFDSTQFQLYYWNGIADPYFQALDATLALYDAESGQTVSCSNLPIALSFLQEYHIWEANLLPLTQGSGCLAANGIHLTPGDSLKITVKARIGEQLPVKELKTIDDLRVRFPFVYHGDSLLCAMKNTDFGVINPEYMSRVEQVFPDQVCDDLIVRIHFDQGSSPAVDSDLFPIEIRPLFVYDSFLVTLSAGYVYQPGSAEWDYEAGDGATTPPVPTQLALADPQVATLPSGEQALLFLRPPGLPVTDYYKGLSPAYLSLRAQMVCPPDTSKTNARFDALHWLATLDSVNLELNIGAEGIPDLNELSLSTLGPISVSRFPTWVVDFCNPGPSFTIGAPILYVENGPALQLTGATDVTNPLAPQVLPLIPIDNAHHAVQALPLPPDGCSRIELQSALADCIPDTLHVLPGFQCTGAAPCVLNRPLSLYFIPKTGLAQVNVTNSPGAPVGLCDPIDYEITVLNIDEGNLYDMTVALTLPQAGQVLVPGSCSVVYNGNTAPLPDPAPGPAGLTWTLNFSQPPFSIEALPGIGSAPGNRFSIRFQLETNCGYIDGSRFFYSTAWSNACGGQQSTPEFVAPDLQISGAPTATNSYQIQLEAPAPASFCAENTLRFSIFNPGDLGPTMANEKIRIVLPGDFTYVPGSLQGLHNGPVSGPAVVPFGNEVFLYLNVLPGVAAGDSMVFSIRVNNGAHIAGCNASYDVMVQMLQTTNLACKNANCDVDFVLVEKPFVLAFEKPAFLLTGLNGTALPFDANLENWQLNFGITNTSATLPGGGTLQVEIRLDNNQNGQLDPSDVLVKTIAVDVNGLLPGATQAVQETANISGLQGCSGLWVVLTDTACSCSQDKVYIPGLRIANAGPDHTICAGASATLGGAPMSGYQYQWVPASPYLSAANAADPAYLFSGNFGNAYVFSETLVLKTTRPQGCVSYDTLQMVTRRVDVTLTPVAVLCFGDSTGLITSSVQGAAGPVTYTWNSGGNTGDQLSGIPAGNYTLAVTDTLGCVDSSTVAVTQPPVLTLGLSPSNFNGFGIHCAGNADGSISALPGGGAGNYQLNWAPAGSGTSISGLAAGTYTATLSDANGCTLSATATLSEPAPLLAAATTLDAMCPDSANGSITVQIQGGVAPFTANGQSVSGNTWVQQHLAGGSYNIVLSDANGCTIQIDTTLQSLFSTFTVSTDSVNCFGGSDGRALVQGSGYPPFQFSWSSGSTLDSITAPAGSYTCLVTDGLGCRYPLAVTLAQPPALSGTALAQPALCNGDSTGQISLSAQGGTAPYTFSRDGQATGPVLTNLPTGNYTLVVTDQKGCTLVLNATVGQPSAVQLALTVVDVLCHGGSTGAVDPNPTGGVAPYAFAWSTGATTAVLATVPAGAYGLTLSDANGCTLSGSATVSEPPAYAPHFQVERIPCADKPTGILSVEGLPAGVLYGLDRAPVSPIRSFEHVGGGAHSVNIRDTLGCVFAFDFEMPALPAELGQVLPDTAIHLGDSVLLHLEFNPDLPAGTALQFQWLNPNWVLSGCDTCPAQWVRPPRTTGYPVRFTTADGCIWDSRALVQVLRDSVFAPNVIFPDAVDNQNRFFTLYGRPGEVLKIRYLNIFDRWGEAVFERRDFPLNDAALGWDGSYRGKPGGPGVFVWVAEVEYADGEVVLLKGDVTVLR